MRYLLFFIALLIIACALSSQSSKNALNDPAPIVVRSFPPAGAADIDPNTPQIQVTFNTDMFDEVWSYSRDDNGNLPKCTGPPSFLPDHRTCILPIHLEPHKTYALWINAPSRIGFESLTHRQALSYLLTFSTK